MSVLFISENAMLNNKCQTSHQRKRQLEYETDFVTPITMKLGPIPHYPKLENVIIFPPQTILDSIFKSGTTDLTDYIAKSTLPYVANIKKTCPATISSYFDANSHNRVMESVPDDQKPPIFLGLYADGVDRDQATHSSNLNKIHLTYLKILNLPSEGVRKKDDFRLLQLCYEDTIKHFGYNSVHKSLVHQLTLLINEGYTINGKTHAVRLCYLQVKEKLP